MLLKEIKTITPINTGDVVDHVEGYLAWIEKLNKFNKGELTLNAKGSPVIAKVGDQVVGQFRRGADKGWVLKKLEENKALKTVAGQDRFGNPIAGRDKYDERRTYVVDADLETIDSFMNMEAATRAMKNNPKKFPKGVKVVSGKELNKHFHSINEEALETKDAEELWSSGNADTYVSTSTYMVRPIKGTEPVKFEVFSVVGDERKPFGKFDARELRQTLKPIRANQTPDVEGFVTYTDPTEVEAFKYAGEPIRVKLDDTQTVQLNKGDYLVRTVKGNNFEYNIEANTDFESTLKKS